MTIVMLGILWYSSFIDTKEQVQEGVQMRVSRAKAAENRERIVETAARLFRENGFDGVGVDAIMKGTGLTHGGFSGLFSSQDEFAAKAVIFAIVQDAGGEGQFPHP